MEAKSRADFVLIIKEDIISLTAKDASLKEITEEIGSRMKIEVVTDIPEEEKITIRFDKLSLEDAVKKLRTSYAYVWNSEKEEGKITKIVLLPEGKGTVLRPTTKESEVKGEKRLVKSESSAGKKIASEKSPRLEPFKFEFDPSEFMEEGK